MNIVRYQHRPQHCIAYADQSSKAPSVKHSPKGGVDPATLDVLVQGGSPVGAGYMAGIGTAWPADDGKLFSKPNSQPIRLGKSDGPWRQLAPAAATSTPHMRGGYSWADDSHHAESWPPERNAGHDLSPEPDEANVNPWSEAASRKGPRDDNTLVFKDLPYTASHKDVTNLIRGGRLVDVWLRKNEREAAVTFAEGAGEFLAWSRKNDLWLSGRWVSLTLLNR